MRCDADGNKVGEAVIDGAQIYAGGQKYLVPLGDDGGFAVTYTVGQLDGTMNFREHLQAFDGHLEPRWARPFVPTSSPRSMQIVRRGAGDEIAAVSSAVGGSPHLVIVRASDDEARAEAIETFSGNFSTKDVVHQPDCLRVLGGFNFPWFRP